MYFGWGLVWGINKTYFPDQPAFNNNQLIELVVEVVAALLLLASGVFFLVRRKPSKN